MTFQILSLVFFSECAFDAADFQGHSIVSVKPGRTVHGNCNCFWEVDCCKESMVLYELAQKLA